MASLNWLCTLALLFTLLKKSFHVTIELVSIVFSNVRQFTFARDDCPYFDSSTANLQCMGMFVNRFNSMKESVMCDRKYDRKCLEVSSQIFHVYTFKRLCKRFNKCHDNHTALLSSLPCNSEINTDTTEYISLFEAWKYSRIFPNLLYSYCIQSEKRDELNIFFAFPYRRTLRFLKMNYRSRKLEKTLSPKKVEILCVRLRSTTYFYVQWINMRLNVLVIDVLISSMENNMKVNFNWHCC